MKLDIKFPRIKLSSAAFIIVYSTLVLFDLHFSKKTQNNSYKGWNRSAGLPGTDLLAFLEQSATHTDDHPAA